MYSVSPEVEKLAKFVIDTRWEDLPDPVVHEAKRLLLDSIGCALGAITTDPGKMTIALARRLGGPPESSVIGVRGKVSCSTAALANGQLISIMDYCALMPGMHAPPQIIPPPLAIAESVGASGKELILATALGFELGARFFTGAWNLNSGLDFEGKIFKEPVRGGQAYSNFGAAAGAGKLLKLDQGKMSHALGLAGHLCKVLTYQTFRHCRERPMTKYEIPGWQNTGAVMAVLLAEMGYMGDTWVLDPDHGFWKFCGYEEGRPDNIFEGLGKTWRFPKVNYKPYPCCRALHALLDCFFSIIDANNLAPEDIDSVKVFGGSRFERSNFNSRELNNIVDVEFGLPSLFALAVHRIRVGVEWLDMDTVRQPKMLEFAKKVSLLVDPEFGKQDVNDRAFRPPVRIEVMAKGKVLTESKLYNRGATGTGTEVGDHELVEKFRHNASRILTEGKIDGAVKALLQMETVENISELMESLTP